MRHPSFNWPTRFCFGTSASLKNTSANSGLPVMWRSGRGSTPGVFFKSMISTLMPLCFGACESVRT